MDAVTPASESALYRLLSEARGLELSPEGIWVAESHEHSSFEIETHDLCAELEAGSFWFGHRNHCIVETVKKFPPNGAIVDLGGGNGFVTRGLREAGFEAMVVEPGIGGARNAQTRGLSPVVCATLESAGFPAASIPAIGLFDVVEHIANDRQFLSGIHSFLLPNGRVYLTVPAYQWLWSHEDVEAGHFRRYTLGGMCRTLRETGFEIEFASYIFAFLPAPIFFLRALPTRLGRQRQVVSSNVAHQSGGRRVSVLQRLLKTTLELEAFGIKHRFRIPFGGSCLVVARADQAPASPSRSAND